MLRMGTHPCDGLAEERKCTACMLQHRGVPQTAAELLARTPAGIGNLLQRLPGRAGALFGLPGFIRDQKARQQRLFASVDRFVLLTEWARRTVLANTAPPAKVSVNRLGIATRPSAPKPAPSVRPTRPPVRLVYLGRFDPIKGVHDLVRALTSLPRELTFRAELIGPVFGPSEQRVVDELRRMIGGDPRSAIAPPVPHAAVPRLLAEIDLVCCPSIVAEGGPTAALEAYAAGTPVIGTRIGGLAELVADGVNGRLVPPGDWRALARTIEDVVRDPSGTIDHWRRALPPPRTFDDVTRDYLAMYAA
jgi:glycosyltransferase involved in cell wall biosynthesis